MKTISVNTPAIGHRELFRVSQALLRTELSGETPIVKRAEKGFSQILGGGHCALVTNGTVALELAFQSINLGPGDEVILPSLTIISCLLPIIKCGATPVFVDSDLRTWQPCIDEIKSKITSDTKAVLYVHLYGLGEDLSELSEVCKSKGVILIEDCSQAIGLMLKGRPAGTFGDLATFSFYPNKLVTSGEGGAVFSSNTELVNRVKSLRNLSFVPEQRFIHHEFSSNSRISGIQAALLYAQLDSIEKFLRKRQLIAKEYIESLAHLPIEFQPTETPSGKNVWWVVGVLFPRKSHPAKAFAERLLIRGVQTRPFFYPLHLQPALRKYFPRGIPRKHLPSGDNSLQLYERGLYLPGGNGFRLSKVRIVSARIRSTYEEFLIA